MKLIHSLLRQILERVESYLEAGPYPPPDFENYSADQINYHIKMCIEAEWLKPSAVTLGGRGRHDRYEELGELTWKGHQELHCLRNGEWDVKT